MGRHIERVREIVHRLVEEDGLAASWTRMLLEADAPASFVRMLAEPPRTRVRAREIIAFEARSERTVRDLVKQVTGLTPCELLLCVKMVRAANRLATSDESVGEIGRAEGYARTSSFDHLFTKVFGHGPTAYRRLRGGRCASPQTAQPIMPIQ